MIYKNKAKFTLSQTILLIAICSGCNHIYSSCLVSAENLSFGNYQTFNSSNLDISSNIYIECPDSTKNNRATVAIKLSAGNSGRFRNRHLINNNNTLSYNIYTTKNRNRIWGDGTGNSNFLTRQVGRRQKVITMYGRITAAQSIPPGTYTDNIIAEISY